MLPRSRDSNADILRLLSWIFRVRSWSTISEHFATILLERIPIIWSTQSTILQRIIFRFGSPRIWRVRIKDLTIFLHSITLKLVKHSLKFNFAKFECQNYFTNVKLFQVGLFCWVKKLITINFTNSINDVTKIWVVLAEKLRISTFFNISVSKIDLHTFVRINHQVYSTKSLILKLL